MIRKLFERKASHEAELLAEAQALLDDGLELEFVLGLFPDDAAWLEPLLAFTTDYEDVFSREPASYYFEASLKSKFLGAAQAPRPVVPVVVTAPSFSPMRTAIASMSVASAAAAIGILSLGFITAGDSVPGDWNYTFKLANERFEYTLSRGDGRIDAQLRQVENRVTELNKLSERGEVSPSQFERVVREFDALQQLSRSQELDALQKSQLESAHKNAAAVINEAATKQPDVAPRAEAAAAAIDDSVAVALATPTGVPTAEPTPATTATPESPTPDPTATGTPTPPDPTETPTPEASATSTTQPSELETPSPAGTPTP